MAEPRASNAIMLCGRPLGKRAHLARLGFACLATIALAAPGLHLAAQGPALPARLEDREFWRLVSVLSEPDGFFEDENYVSNELGYQRSMRRLRDAVSPGGAFVGVGPEQNFAYIAAIRPHIAFIVDIRRQNLVQHLMYKALFDLSKDRADYLSRLFSRPRPGGLDSGSSATALLAAFAAVAPDRALFDETHAAMLAVFTSRGFALTPADLASLRKVFTAFFELGPEVRYIFRGTSELHPTYAQMVTAADEAGQVWSYLGSAEIFEQVRSMQERNLIVPVVGDFAGPKALRSIGDYLRDHGAAVSVFYASNVESYLFAAGTSKAFYDSLDAMPRDPAALFVRAFFGSAIRECAALKPTLRTPVIAPMSPFMAAYRRGDIRTQCDVVGASR
jgi:hypothetical protein